RHRREVDAEVGGDALAAAATEVGNPPEFISRPPVERRPGAERLCNTHAECRVEAKESESIVEHGKVAQVVGLGIRLLEGDARRKKWEVIRIVEDLIFGLSTRVVNDLEALDDCLVENGFVHRYRIEWSAERDGGV